MPLNVGSRLAHYNVTAKIGEGGMGEVYRARDTKLDRDVALKVLPQAFTDDPDRLARFEREAKVLASLNHPNIGHIYGLEEAEGQKALVLELVEGPTLAERIKQGPIPVEEALPIAKQIAEALEAAHEQGIIHRDLKPANIKVKDDGTVKVLDFGLAKAFQPDASDVSASMSPTISLTAAATQMGMVIGTAAYMSPEQAKGNQVDRRADIWAFGCVLYEMLTGRRVFDAPDVSEVLASVLLKDPDLTSVPTDVPPSVRTLLGRCLVKESKDRLRDVGEARIALQVPVTPASATLPSSHKGQGTEPRDSRQLLRLAGGTLVLGLAIGSYSVWSLGPATMAPVSRFAIIASGLATVGLSSPLALSPDGRTLVYVAINGTRQLYQRPLEQLEPTPIRGTEGAAGPVFSPDGQWVAFWTLPPDGFLKKVSLSGGPSVTLTPVGNFRWAAWGADGTIIFAAGGEESGLWRVADSGGVAQQIATVEEEGARYIDPQLTPDGRAVLFTIAAGEQRQVAVRSLESGEQRVLLDGASAHLLSTGHLLFSREDSLWAVPFDVDRLELAGEPSPVLEGVQTNTDEIGRFAVGGDGSLAYVTGEASAEGTRVLVWVGRDGREESIAMPARPYFAARLSPDRTQLAVEVRGDNTDVWVHDLARGTQSRLTFDPGLDRFPVWTPDGERIAFSSNREGGTRDIFWKLAVGTGQPELVVSYPEEQLDSWSWTPDGQSLLINENGVDISMVTLGGDQARQPVLEEAFNEGVPEVSPDGQWMAYRSSETGQLEVFVRPFPDVAGGKWQISTTGGNYPAWSPDGRELFYRRPSDRALMRVTVETEPTFIAGIPEPLIEGDYVFAPGQGRNWDVSLDGQRFLMLKSVGTGIEDAAPPQIIFVQNWFEELKERVPIP